MAIDIEEYRRLQKRVDRAKEEAAKAQGVWEQAMSAIKAEYGCDSIPAAQKLLAKLDKEAAAAEAAYNTALAAFEEEWADVLGELPEAG
jgi:predicted  nucleic acid-binding Zn-ribbon protein